MMMRRRSPGPRPGRGFTTAGTFLALVAGSLLISGCGDDNPTGPAGQGDPRAALSGGETTIFNATSQAFTFPAPNLADLGAHLEGDLAFDAQFVSNPAPVNGGLGPLFNENACVACHVGNGRGMPILPGEPSSSTLFRISVPGHADDGTGGPRPVSGLGTQLNHQALFGVVPEGRVEVTHVIEAFQFPDGQGYELVVPSYTLVDAAVDLPGDLLISPRMAPPVFGLGLLEAVPDAAILDLADPGDADGDSVSGRPNLVWDVLRGATVLGRFGLKANTPTLVQQAAAAYRNDMGITNALFPADSFTEGGPGDGLADDPELDLETVELVAFYTQTLAVPARRNLEHPRVRRGEELFETIGCAACHVPTLVTGDRPEFPELSRQTIHPYSDLLLHDLGEGLADGRPDFLAEGREWRTPPLWGLGLTAIVSGHTFLLHDGRARSIVEAIMWHGGEADPSRRRFAELSAEDREAVEEFLRSL